jgi:dTDP-6-deoxy-L-talose 4-dehydrogenase (NAD+)
MKKVLVTGSGGYIGRHVTKEFLDHGYEVIAADLNNDNVDPRATKINTSIFSDIEDPYTYFGSPDICVHLAWRNGFVHNAPTHMQDVSAHFTFLKKLIDSGISRVAVMGTMHEVGYWEGAIDENTPCKPLSLYGIAKNALRESVLHLVEGTQTKLYWLRAYYILGDDFRNHSIFSKIMQMAAEGKKSFPFTSGKNLYDFIEVEELARLICASVSQDKYTGMINVCTGEPRSLGEQVKLFIAKHGLDISPEYGAFPDRAYDSPGVWGNADKIKKILSERGK